MKYFRIREIAEGKKVSFRMLMGLADISEGTLKKLWEDKDSNPTLDTLTSIANALEVSIDDLLVPGRKGKETPQFAGSSR
jgi:DNA-binding Xre family transcriptional regulator